MTQGAIQLLYELEQYLAEISGSAAMSSLILELYFIVQEPSG